MFLIYGLSDSYRVDVIYALTYRDFDRYGISCTNVGHATLGLWGYIYLNVCPSGTFIWTIVLGHAYAYATNFYNRLGALGIVGLFSFLDHILLRGGGLLVFDVDLDCIDPYLSFVNGYRAIPSAIGVS